MKRLLLLMLPLFVVACADTKLVRAPGELVYPTRYAPTNAQRHRIGTVSYDTTYKWRPWRPLASVWRNKEDAYRTMYETCENGEFTIVRPDYSAHPRSNPMHGGKTTAALNSGGSRAQTFYIDFRCDHGLRGGRGHRERANRHVHY